MTFPENWLNKNVLVGPVTLLKVYLIVLPKKIYFLTVLVYKYTVLVYKYTVLVYKYKNNQCVFEKFKKKLSNM